MGGSLEYVRTHENLASIVKGLEPCSSDVIIDIGGSGDNAFALTEDAGEVRVIDSNSAQIAFIRRRYDLLRDGNVDEFLSFMRGRNRAYMERRIEKIRKHLDRMVIREPEDIFEAVEHENGFNKAYLSTAPYYSGFLSEGGNKIEVVSANLPTGGLVYLSVSNDFWKTPTLAVDYIHTIRARFFNLGNSNYHPVVFRKVG